MSDMKDAAERATEEAFERSPWRDPRAGYRALLRHLRERDADAFGEAVADYEARVVAPVASGSVDPVRAWLAFGTRLAERLGGGRTVRIDPNGLEIGTSDTPVEPIDLLLHLPADESARALPVAIPREITPAQQATLALLAEGRQALPG